MNKLLDAWRDIATSEEGAPVIKIARDTLLVLVKEAERLQEESNRRQNALNHLLNAVSANAAPDLMAAARREAEAAL